MEEVENIPGAYKVLVGPVAEKGPEKKDGEIQLEGMVLVELAAGKGVEKGDGEILFEGMVLAESAAEQEDAVMLTQCLSVAGRVVVVEDEAILLRDTVVAEGDVEVEVEAR